jgi:hypothetical protein
VLSDALRLIPTLSLTHRGDCRRCARVSIKNLVIDGNRRKLGRIPEHDEAYNDHELGKSSEELDDDGGNGDEVDWDARAREMENNALWLAEGRSAVGMENIKVVHVEDDGEEVSGSTSPLILLGNNEGQVVSGCTIKDPR